MLTKNIDLKGLMIYMLKFKLPKERKIDLTIISKESNITTNDIIDNFIESII